MVIASVVDIARLLVYSERFLAADLLRNGPLLGAAALAAFSGAVAGSRLLRKISFRSIEVAVAVLLVLIAAGLGSGAL